MRELGRSHGLLLSQRCARQLCLYTYCLSRSNFFGGKQLRVYEGVKSSPAWRINSWGTWRPREGSRNVHNIANRRALNPSHPCHSVTAGVHGGPPDVAPLRHHTASRATPVGAHERSNASSVSLSS